MTLPLPPSPDLDHLKKQARDLLRAAQQQDPAALVRFRDALPAARSLTPAQLAAFPFRLHDAQSCLAREYGFVSWADLKLYVAWKAEGRGATATERARWLKLVYGDSANPRHRTLAARLLRETPALAAGDPYLACAIGDVDALARETARDPAWINRPGGPLAMPPLVAATHSALSTHPTFAAAMERAARFLLDHGADPNARWTSADHPEWPLSALYGAAGKHHSAALTRLLLDRGAAPDDNESLYHAQDTADDACTRLLLAAHATVAGTNAINRCLDFDRLARLQLLLDHAPGIGPVLDRDRSLFHAILRGRSTAHIRALLAAGADPAARNKHGRSAAEYARLMGREDLAALLMPPGVQPAGETRLERFVLACTSGRTAEARTLLAEDPTLTAQLTERQRRLLPELADAGNLAGVRAMLACGWPLETKGLWGGSALNMAVFHGNAAMTRLLLEHGARWDARHDYGGNAMGTLGYGSCAQDIDHEHGGDYLGCARALLEHGMPLPPEDFEFSPALESYFHELRLQAGPS